MRPPVAESAMNRTRPWSGTADPPPGRNEDVAGSEDPLLHPVSVGQLTLLNRVVVAPMSRASARGDGAPTAKMGEYDGGFVRGGFGLLITEGTYVEHAHGQAYANQPGLVTDRQLQAWAEITAKVQAVGGAIFLQLMHAGALVQGNHHRDVAVAPSAVRPKGRMLARGYGGSGTFNLPREMSHDDIAPAVDGFVQTAVRARVAALMVSRYMPPTAIYWTSSSPHTPTVAATSMAGWSKTGSGSPSRSSAPSTRRQERTCRLGFGCRRARSTIQATGGAGQRKPR